MNIFVTNGNDLSYNSNVKEYVESKKFINY